VKCQTGIMFMIWIYKVKEKKDNFLEQKNNQIVVKDNVLNLYAEK